MTARCIRLRQGSRVGERGSKREIGTALGWRLSVVHRMSKWLLNARRGQDVQDARVTMTGGIGGKGFNGGECWATAEVLDHKS